MSTSEVEPAPPSKTQRKRAMTELQELGQELVDLAPDRIRKMNLPEDLRAAVREALRMTRHDEARRRQVQYVGRLMRNVDPEPIRRALAALRGDSIEETAKLHRIERLRTDFLVDEKVLYRIASENPLLDLQHLRALRRSALIEQEKGRPPRCYRAIFQILKDLENTASTIAEEDWEESTSDEEKHDEH